MDLEQWKRWWRSDGFGRLRGLVLDHWDPIGGSPDDEYDDLVLQLGRRLRSGARRAEIAAFLDDAERDLVGGCQEANNQRAARLIVGWYASETGEPVMTRNEALGWIRQEARRIADEQPTATDLFDWAQRAELILCQHTWLDDEFPATVRPFVWGWNISGDESDREIREAARLVAADPWFREHPEAAAPAA